MLTITPQTTPWNELDASSRGVAFVEDMYGTLPDVHLEQIHRVTASSLSEMNRWLDVLLPPTVSADQLGFSESRFLQLEESSWNTDDGIQSVRQWLHDCGVPYGTTVFLFYDRAMILAMPWKLVLRYWNAWAWSVGYSMIAVDSTCQWACMFHHENVIQFGRHTENKTEQWVATERANRAV
ncbi:MAG: hypothetical protein ACK5PZ_20390 [Pirellula sp.]|jgi:hypothetical protein